MRAALRAGLLAWALSGAVHAQSTRGVKDEPRPGAAVAIGTSHALLIGVSRYADGAIPSLEQPDADLTRLADVLRTRYAFEASRITTLRNATRADILQALDSLTTALTIRDNLLIFYAGHGIWEDRLQQGFWLPSDATRASRAGWISNATIRDYARGIPARHVLLIADACFAGGLFATRALAPLAGAPSAEIGQLNRLPSRKAMTSGTLTTVPDKSVFLDFLIKRLNENSEPFLPASVLFTSLRAPVINNSPTNQVPQYGVVRETGDEGGEFVFVARGAATAARLPTATPAESPTATARALPTETQPDDLLRGRQAFATGDWTTAFTAWSRACAAQQQVGCVGLARLLARGLGTAKNPERAFTLASTACASGLADGCGYEAALLTIGLGTPVNLARADSLMSANCTAGSARSCTLRALRLQEDSLRGAEMIGLLRKSCDANDAMGCSLLGRQYMEGRHVQRDLVRAVALTRAACDSGAAAGCEQLGRMYLDGQGVLADSGRAAKLFADACDRAELSACFRIGTWHLNGWGVPINVERGLTVLSAACEAGDTNSCWAVGTAYMTGPPERRNLARALAMLRPICDGGDADGCASVGNIYELGDSTDLPPRDPARAIEYYTRACDGRSGGGCLRLGQVTANRLLGGSGDVVAAAHYYARSCDLDFMLGCEQLAQSYESGTGVPADRARALQLYRRVCDGGLRRGCARVSALTDPSRPPPLSRD